MLHRVGGGVVAVLVHKAAAVVHIVAVAVHIRAAGHKAAADHRQAAGHRHYVVDGAGGIAAGSYSKDLEFRSAAARHSKEELEAEDWPESIFALGTVMGVRIDCYGHEPGQQRPFLLQLARDQKHSYRDLLLGPRNKP